MAGRILRKVIAILGSIAGFIYSTDGFGQGSIQQLVRISNPNGTIVTLRTDRPDSSFTLFLPNNISESLTVPSLLYSTGSGVLEWSPTSGADSGSVLMLMRQGGILRPKWSQVSSSGSGGVAIDEPLITFDNDRGSLTNNRVLSIGNGLSITNTGVDNGSIIIRNEGVIRLDQGDGISLSDTSGYVRVSTPAWLKTGNLNTNAWNGATGDYIGTSDDQDLVIGTGSTTSTREKLRIDNTTGNLYIKRPGAGLHLQSTNGTGTTLFQAGAQGDNNIVYTLPATLPTVDGQVLAASTTGSLSWVTQTVDTTTGSSGSSSGITGSGTATRIAFWGPGPGVTTNLQDDANLFWDNSSKRLSIGAGTSPTATIHTMTSGSLTNTSTSLLLSNTSSSGTNAINKTGLSISASGSWGNGSSSTSKVIGLDVNVDGATNTSNNIAALFNGGRVGIGNTAPNTSLDISQDYATREYVYSTLATGTLNNMNFDGQGNKTAFLRLTIATAPFNLAGIANGVDGKIISIYNATSQSMTVLNESSTSSAANRIVTGTPANIPLPAGGTANLIYSNSQQRWIVRSISGAAGWLYTGNSGLTDNSTNFLGTLDSTSIRFVSGNSGPKTRMLLDPRGNLIFGANAGTTTFTTGQGKVAFGDSLNTTRLNSLPTFGARVFNMIDPNAVVRVWRFNSNAGGTDPAVELIGGTNDMEINAANTKWDFYTTGTPGVPLTGTRNQGEHFAIRRRTNGNDSVYMSVFAGSGVRIGTDSSGTARYTPNKLAVLSHDNNTNGIMDIAALEHIAIGAPSAGLGAGLVFRGETSTQATQDMARVAGVWTDVNNASRSGALTFGTVNNASAMTERMRISPAGYLGVNTTDPLSTVDINGSLATRRSNITLSAGQNNNVNIGASSYVNIVGPTSAFSISGFATGSDGQILRVINTTGQDMSILNENTSSTASNRVKTHTNGTVVLSGTSQTADFMYDGSQSRWVLVTSNAEQISGPIGSIFFASKDADETVTNSATLQDDDHLQFFFNANETWEVTGEIDVQSTSSTPNIRIAFDAPSGAVIRMFYTAINDGNGVQSNSLISASNTPKTINVASNVSTYISFRGAITMGNTSGNVKFRWAQGTSNSAAIRIKQYSYLKATRLR